jgi:hypothetical protein
MKTLRTTLSQGKRANRRLLKAGYDIQQIETRHTETGEHTDIIWSRPARPGEYLATDFPISELPY